MGHYDGQHYHSSVLAFLDDSETVLNKSEINNIKLKQALELLIKAVEIDKMNSCKPLIDFALDEARKVLNTI